MKTLLTTTLMICLLQLSCKKETLTQVEFSIGEKVMMKENKPLVELSFTGTITVIDKIDVHAPMIVASKHQDGDTWFYNGTDAIGRKHVDIPDYELKQWQ